MDKQALQEEAKNYPIKLEYYKTVTREENLTTKYGIEVVKTEFINGNVKIESSKLDNLTNNEEEATRILTTLRDGEVTPIAMEYVIEDMFA